MGNISNERKYRIVANLIDEFISDLIYDNGLNLQTVDREILNLLMDAQNKALQISISFEERVKENM